MGVVGVWVNSVAFFCPVLGELFARDRCFVVFVCGKLEDVVRHLVVGVGWKRLAVLEWTRWSTCLLFVSSLFMASCRTSVLARGDGAGSTLDVCSGSR